MGVPGGTVTLFFTDMEGSTELAERLPSAWQAVLADHRRLLTDAIVSNGGREIDSRGEEVFAVFESARSAVKAALAAQRAHARHPWPGGAQVRVRIGIHTGEPTVGDTGYLGLEVHRAARICGLAHGGQILLTRPTRELVFEQPAEDLGEIALKGLSRPEQVFQLVALDLPRDFPPLRGDHVPEPEPRDRQLADVVRVGLDRPAPLRLRWVNGLRRDDPGLAELGWQVRRNLPAADPARRTELASFAGELFTAGRSAVDADPFPLADGSKGVGEARSGAPRARRSLTAGTTRG
jgi:class 3 adenylate cyclase